MHLAQTMIKGTVWERMFFGQPTTAKDERWLKEWREACDRIEAIPEQRFKRQLKTRFKQEEGA